ncbi:MAG: MFS transporter [Porticoccaceae bacterium]
MQTEILDTKKITLPQFWILALCYVAMMLNGFANVIISYTAPAISQSWGVSAEELGLVFSAGLCGMTVGAMFLSSAADVYGRRLLVSAAIALTGVATLVVCVIDSVPLLIASRFVAGIGLGAILAVLLGFGGEYCPKDHREFILAALVSATSVGAVLGGLATPWSIDNHGWQSVYLGTGLLTLAVAALFYALIPESLQHLANRGGSDALAKINRILDLLRQPRLQQLPESGAAKPEAASASSLLAPARRRMTLLAWATFFIGFAGMYFIVSWLPKLFVDAGIPEAQSIQAVVILTFGSMTGSLLIGWLARFWPLRVLIAISFATAAVLILVLSLVIRGDQVGIFAVWALSFLLGVSYLGAFANLYAVALSIYPPTIRVTGLGWCIGLGRVGAIISPMVAGVVLGAGAAPANVLAWSAVAVALAAIGIRLVRPAEETSAQ